MGDHRCLKAGSELHALKGMSVAPSVIGVMGRIPLASPQGASRIRRVAWGLLAAWLVWLGPPQRSPVAEDPPAGKHFLWQVDSPTTRVYLLGSIHLLHQDIYPLAPVIEEAFAASEVLVLEADVFAESQDARLQSSMDDAIYQPGRTLKSELSQPDYLELMDILSRVGIPIQSVQQFRPWFLSLMVQQVLWSRLGLRAEYGIDAYFRTKAAGQKDIEELESVDAQLAMLSSLSDQEHILLLSRDTEDLEQGVQELDELLRIWQRGDSEAMEQALRRDIQDEPRFEPMWDIMVNDRNLGMADRIVACLASTKRYFVVVGAAHLIGQQGLVALLQQRGYAVQQL